MLSTFSCFVTLDDNLGRYNDLGHCEKVAGANMRQIQIKQDPHACFLVRRLH